MSAWIRSDTGRAYHLIVDAFCGCGSACGFGHRIAVGGKNIAYYLQVRPLDHAPRDSTNRDVGEMVFVRFKCSVTVT